MIKLLFIFFTQALATLTSLLGCVSEDVTGRGVIAKFYSYPLLSDAGFSEDFFTSGYRTEFLGSVENVQSLNFRTETSTEPVTEGNIYGYPISTSNYTVELSGYFLPPVAGVYEFIATADTGVSFQLGRGLRCCKDADSSVTREFGIKEYGSREGNLFLRKHTASYELELGVYYPIKIVHFNHKTVGGISVGYKHMNGVKVNDIGLQIHQIRLKHPTCDEATSYSYWTHDHTSITTVYPSDGDIPTKIVVLPPMTTTDFWTEAYTSTTTMTPSDGGQPTVIIKIPTSRLDPPTSFVSEVSSTTSISLPYESLTSAEKYSYFLNSLSSQNFGPSESYDQTASSRASSSDYSETDLAISLSETLSSVSTNSERSQESVFPSLSTDEYMSTGTLSILSSGTLIPNPRSTSIAGNTDDKFISSGTLIPNPRSTSIAGNTDDKFISSGTLIPNPRSTSIAGNTDDKFISSGTLIPNPRSTSIAGNTDDKFISSGTLIPNPRSTSIAGNTDDKFISSGTLIPNPRSTSIAGNTDDKFISSGTLIPDPRRCTTIQGSVGSACDVTTLTCKSNHGAKCSGTSSPCFITYSEGGSKSLAVFLIVLILPFLASLF